VLVLFYDQNCPISRGIIKEWALVPRLLPPTNLTLAQLDCTTVHDYCDSVHSVRGYPHLRLYKPSPQRAAEFAGARTTVGIARFARAQLRPASLPLVTRPQLEHELRWNKGRVMAFAWLGGGAGSTRKVREIWFGAAELLRSHSLLLAHTEAVGVLSGSQPAVTLLVPGERRVRVPLRSFSSWRLHLWLRARSVPLWGQLKESNYLSYAKTGLPVGLVFSGPLDTCAMHAPVMRSLALRLRGRISLAHVPMLKAGLDPRLTDNRQTPWFAVRAHADSPDLRSSGGDLIASVCDPKEIEKAALSFLEGDSVPLDMPNREAGYAVALTQSLFEEVVLDPTKDVLLLVHGGWHTQAADALVALHKVAQATEFVGSCVVAELALTADAESSIHPILADVQFDQLQLLLVAAGNNSVHQYTGQIAKAAHVLKFLRSSARQPIKIDPKELLLLRQLKTVQLAGDAARAALVHNRRLTKMAVALKAELDKKTQRLACMPK